MVASYRIVSLLPSATEILDCLGLTPNVVGRSHECDYPLEIGDRPVCTAARLDSERPSGEIDQEVLALLQGALGIYEVKLDVLQALQPTHIVTQDQCDVCAVTLADVQKAIAQLSDHPPQLISLQPNTLADVYQDIRRVAQQFNRDPQPVLQDLQQRVQACQKRGKTLAKRPRVAAIEWIDPLMGGGNWLPELIELAGGENILGKPGKHSPYISWETLLASDPDVVVVMPCGFDLERTRQEMLADLELHPEWKQLRAVQNDQLFICDGNAYFNRPGPRLVDSLEILTEILQPTGDRLYPKTAWQKLSLFK
ncbi:MULTISPECIES: cobalamin-binding protein [Cyanophyceae]|uniref:cobalamin-binding protein n=1 Tax=Cyanophyceae TaxID=3028117 RepID=UPI00016DC4FB|nr:MULTISPECIES: cobalamin-binding protein [Cyanophyceae]ACA98020.1 periplasmic solute-binding protein of ABC transporter [Picosynechococcus sp. PCC 7002]SMH47594.1 iron complex transport system substrate-binding protein [Picosynechococcus sp. OG1]SMQ81039.1 iron complex transport system substrate-binding protein [Synechococcus sp. 7002]